MHACNIISVHFSEIVPLSPPGFILSLPLRAHECEDSYVSCNIQPEHSISKAGYKCTPFNWLKHSRRTMVRPKMATRHVTTFRLNLQSDFIIFSYPRSIPYYELTYKFGEIWEYSKNAKLSWSMSSTRMSSLAFPAGKGLSGRCKNERKGRDLCQQRSLPFLSFLPRRERPLLAGNLWPRSVLDLSSWGLTHYTWSSQAPI